LGTAEKIGLERLFNAQDEVLQEHLASSEDLKQAADFISVSVSLNMDILQSMRFEENKQTAIRRLAVDSISHTVVAVRLGLWGDLPESLAILRSAIESNAQLQFVVKEQMYETFAYEMERKLDRTSFDTSIAGLGDLGKRIRIIHGRMSDIAAHSTASRSALVSYKFEGEFYDRVGFARNVDNAEFALFYCMDSSMMPTEAFVWAYEQENIPFKWVSDVNGLSARFETIKKALSEKFRDSKKE
jgi:hypothetical protein